MPVFSLIKTWVLLFALLFFSGAAYAKAYPEIVIKGDTSIDLVTLLKYSQVDLQNTTNQGLNELTRFLYASGYFEDIRVTSHGAKLILEVKQRPNIKEIKIVGNKKLKEKELLKIIKQKQDSPLAEQALVNDLENALDLAKMKGLLKAKISYKIEPISKHECNLVIEVSEGKVHKIEKINFVGNSAFSDEQLKNIILSSEQAISHLFTGRDTAISLRLPVDKMMIARFYLSNNFSRARVISSIMEAKSDNKAIITFILDENKRFTISDVNFSDEFKDKVIINDLNKLTFAYLNKIIEKLSDDHNKFSSFRYALNPSYEYDGDKIKVKYSTLKDRKKVIANIILKGNYRTKNYVILNSLRFEEGGIYEQELINRSKQSLQNLGFFKSVEISPVENLVDDTVDVIVNVEEDKTGNAEFRLSFSSSEGVMGSILFKERNFLGKGRLLKFDIEKTGLYSNYDFSILESQLFHNEFSVGGDIVWRNTNKTRESPYLSRTIGGSTRLLYDLSRYLSHQVYYTHSHTKIFDMSPGASIYLQEQAGNNIVSGPGHTLSLNRLDNSYRPRSGYIATLAQDISGIFSSEHLRFVRSQAEFKYFYTNHLDWRFSFSIRGGAIGGYADQEVKLSQRFFLGAGQMRGFAYKGIGPRDQQSLTGDALGGKYFYNGSAQVDFPLFDLLRELNLRGSFFLDFGNLTGLDQDYPGVVDESKTRISIGLGLVVDLPVIGPIRFDFGFPIRRSAHDMKQIPSIGPG